MEDKDNVAIRGDTLLSAITYTKIRIATTKINTPDKYYGDRRKLKTFII